MAEIEIADLAPNEGSKTFSLNIEEVNDNPEELIDLRGKGRYFGNGEDSQEIICRNCHKAGHKASQCSTVICLACGISDDHYTEQCPRSITCTNCGEKGHYKNSCKKKQQRIFCTKCESNKHKFDRCPTIWRSYVTDLLTDIKIYPSRFIYCYNCGTKGHFGDECSKQRSSRVPNLDGSAFSGENLPRNLRDEYFHLLKKRHYEDELLNDYDDYSNEKFFHFDYQKEKIEDDKHDSKRRKLDIKSKNKKSNKCGNNNSKKDNNKNNSRGKYSSNNSKNYNDNYNSYNNTYNNSYGNNNNYSNKNHNNKNNNNNKNYNKYNDTYQPKRSGELPPRSYKKYGAPSAIIPSRSGILGKNNNKTNSSNRKKNFKW